MLRILALLSLLSLNAYASGKNMFSYTVTNPDGDVREINLTGAEDGGVCVAYRRTLQGQSEEVSKCFAPEVLRELEKRLGEKNFEFSAWKSDSECKGGIAWTVRTRKGIRIFCRNRQPLSALRRFQLSIQRVMLPQN